MTADAGAMPPTVTALQSAYGPPSQAGFGGAVFFDRLAAGDDLETAARERYRYFVGDLWERWGEDAWMGPWKRVHARPAGGARDVVAELEAIEDADARRSVPLLLETAQDADAARAALAAAFDDPAVSELAVYTVGDGDAMSGLLVAGRRDPDGAIVLIALMD